IPQDRNGHPPAVVGLRPQIYLIQILRLADGIGDNVRARLERPAMLAHIGVDDRYTDHFFESFQASHNQCTVRPWAGERHIKMVALGFGPKATHAAGPRAAVSGDPVAELSIAADKASARTARIIPLVMPFSIYEKTHF